MEEERVCDEERLSDDGLVACEESWRVGEADGQCLSDLQGAFREQQDGKN